MGRILDGDPKAAPCCLRGDFLNALSNFDKNWGARFKTKEKKPTLKENVTRAMMIVSMGCTLAWDDLLTVFFLATRTPVSQPLYCCAVSMSICCEYMKTTIKLKTSVAARIRFRFAAYCTLPISARSLLRLC